MIKAVLLDLDDTLLRIDTPRFVARYLSALAQWLAARHPGLSTSAIDAALRVAARAVTSSRDPSRSNRDVFNEYLSVQLGLPLMSEAAREFHALSYETLSDMAQPVPGATALLRKLIEQGVAVVIATNPLFSLDAVRRRMAWVGLPSDLPYALVTNMDEMHFTKPHPHYYEEILARVGVEADEAIMVGDSLENDIRPAAFTGMATFWVTDQGPGERTDGAALGEAPHMAHGTLGEFATRVAHGWLAELAERSPAPRLPAQIAPRMVGNTGAMLGMIDATHPKFWNMRPDPNEWTPLEVICHLRDSEREVQRPRLQRIAAEDNPFIAAPPAPPGPGARDCSGEDPFQVFREFWAERQETLTFLSLLSAEDWQRPARHSIFGPTTLLEMAHFTTRHDRLHLNQLCQTIGQCKPE